MTEAYKSEYANVHRGLHYLANAATEAYEGARGKVAKFINAGRTEEIIFTRNVTEAINLVASSWGEPNIKQGDENVLSIMEHHSNIVPWHFLRERHGAVIKWAPVDDDGNFLIEEFEKLLTPRTKLVAITQMSNALGTFVPVKEVVKAAHEQDLLTYAQERLREINSLRLIGTARGKGPVISFEMKGAHPHDVATVIDRQGIAVRAGTHCVMPLLERFNVTATCRASFGMYNTREEVDHLAQALIKARELFS